jgi:hypothetical protein
VSRAERRLIAADVTRANVSLDIAVSLEKSITWTVEAWLCPRSATPLRSAQVGDAAHEHDEVGVASRMEKRRTGWSARNSNRRLKLGDDLAVLREVDAKPGTAVGQRTRQP